ncbi:LamG-like jellyroll fold domain-containing protein [Microbacterium testaceum]|uniref:LamG-like jellyroll fold domain-containing protein n=1 Tax=Microbacterium testaceum TaxID=2033 RepID=UPI00187C5969|nr:LamG-like jellyroll fold domain-containing protein [Microbacterium testaceum]
MRLHRPLALLVAATLTTGSLTLSAAPAFAATPSPVLSYDFSNSAAVGSGVSAGATVSDAAGSHAGTVRGAGATVVAGPRGGDDKALRLPGGAAGSNAAFVEIAPGLTSSATTDVTMSAWMRWEGNQSCAWAYTLGQSTDRYLFTTPACGGRLIGAVKAGSEQRALDEGPAAVGRWSHVAVVLRSGVSVSTYVDGELAQTTPTAATGAATVGTSTFSGLLGKSFYGPDPFFIGALDDVHVYDQALTAAQVKEDAAPAASAIARTDADAARPPVSGAVTSDIALPTSGTGGSTVTWTSSDPAVIDATGKVTRPAAGSPDATVTLTPTATFAGATATGATATLTVRADSATDAADRLRAALVVPPVVASGTSLPEVSGYTVAWSADGKTLDSRVLSNTTSSDQVRQITARITVGSTTVEKTFSVTVLSSSTGRQLVSYTRNATGEHDANHDSVAHSLHLALGTSVDDAAPLYKNGGVVFAEGEFFAVDRVDPRGMANPSLFTFADGTIGVIATRVRQWGAADGTETSSALVFKARDASATDFDELGLIDLGTTGGVASPRAVYDSAEKRYLVSWTDATGTAKSTTVTDLARTELRTAPFWPTNGGTRSWIVTEGNRGEVRSGAALTVSAPDLAGFAGRVADARPAGTLAVSAATAKALTDRLGRVVNTSVTVDPQTITSGDTASLAKTKAKLAYSDGSTAQLGIDWNSEQLDQLATAGPGTYTLSGTVRQHQYAEPFAYNRADPTIYRYERDGKTRYLFIATDDTNNNNVGSAHLPIRVADTIDQLADDNGGRDREIDLLNRYTRGDRTTEGRVIAGCYWAPEIHEIGGKLSILFAPCFNPDNPNANEGGQWFTVQAHIMQLRDGGDPANPNDWSQPSAVRKADGSPLGRAEFGRNISLDMTSFVSGGVTYYAWSQRYTPEGAPLSDPATWIAKVDPSNPTRLISDPVPIIVPSLSFEERLAEGAFAIQRNGRITLVYSSDGVSPKYIVGGAWADESSDLTDINSWHKYDMPLLKSEAMPAGVWDYRTYQQGPGHGAVTTDEDGNDLYVYHTWGDGVGGNGRDTRITRIHYAAGDRPIFDMTRDEEVLPSLRTVTTTVTVRASVTAIPTVSTRCVAGKVTVTATVKNAGSTRFAATVATPWGKKALGSIDPGARASAAFSTRAESVPTGSITVTATTTVDGKTVSSKATAAYDARSCR